MISFDEALALVAEVARPLGNESVPIAEAAGRVLAAPVVAMIDSPPADSSAMDGYAVREADLPGLLRVSGESFAGRGFDGRILPGTCVRIFTGAPVPDGADRVVIQEMVERDGNSAVFPDISGKARHIRERGSDFRAGEILLQTGRILDPRALVAAAAADVAEVEVFRQPELIILGTGDELAPPGEARARAGAIPESVSFGVAALAGQWGAVPLGTRRLADEIEAMERAADEALNRADLVVVTGGASVGEKDFAMAMFEPHGLELIFSKVSIKPGKPVWLGRARGKLVLGLPGNPTSAMVAARLLLAPLVAGVSGSDALAALEWRNNKLANDVAAPGVRETFARGRAEGGEVQILCNQDSSAQKTLADCDMLVRLRPGNAAIAAGSAVETLAF